MMLKRIIALFLVFTLLLQVLPVKQVGYVLFSNQINEEIPHGMDVAKETLKQTLFNDGLSHFTSSFQLLNNIGKTYCFAFYASDIPNNHSTEVPTPPPNI